MRMLLIVAIASWLLTGCKSEQQKEREAELAAPGPLEFDPTDHYELPRWWANGAQMLRLDSSGEYSLYGSSNRYGTPLEYGRWGKQSYAKLWLEPYTTQAPDPRRVTITKIDGKLALLIPGRAPMKGIDKPPLVIEDRLLGAWSGALGTLVLNPNMRYSLSTASLPSVAQSGEAVIHSGGNGRWQIIEKQLILRPDAPGAPILQLPLIIEPTRVIINAPSGPLSRARDDRVERRG